MNKRNILTAAEIKVSSCKRIYCIRNQIFTKELNTSKNSSIILEQQKSL
jgi:hypothetical protein